MKKSEMPGVNSKLNTFSDQVNNSAFTVRFWGVRGYLPSAGPLTHLYGGNTPCVELSVAGKHLIFDGGTGLRPLGEHLCKCYGESSIEACLFFTHTQNDRIQGFPFFRPAFQHSNRISIFGPQSTNGASIKHALSEQMLRPRSIIPFHKMKAELAFKTVSPGSCVTLDDVMIETVSLNNTNSALGYRITWNDRAVVYATDSYDAASLNGLNSIARNADLLIFDAVQSSESCFDSESSLHIRDLSTWKQRIGAILEAGVKQAVAFYYDPAHEDDFLSKVESEMQLLYPSVQMAREGYVITVC